MKLSIVKRDSVDVVGVKISTDMKNAAADCAAIWNSFMPEMMKHTTVANGSYGISKGTDLSLGKFDYIAAIPAGGFTIPNGMSQFHLDGGEYLMHECKDLSEMEGVFQYVYSQWKSEEYNLDHSKPCYEYYHADWTVSGRYDLYFPLVKK